MIDKIQASMAEAVAVIPDGASVLVGGFGEAGVPYELLHCLAELGRRDLTIISNNAGTFERGIAALLIRRQVRKIICSHPRPPNSEAFARAYRAGEVELECVPQGTLAERLRAAGSGWGRSIRLPATAGTGRRPPPGSDRRGGLRPGTAAAR